MPIDPRPLTSPLWFCVLLVGCISERQYCSQALSCDDAGAIASTASQHLADSGSLSPTTRTSDAAELDPGAQEEGFIPGAAQQTNTSREDPPIPALDSRDAQTDAPSQLDGSASSPSDFDSPGSLVTNDAGPTPPTTDGGCAESPTYEADSSASEGFYADCGGARNGGTCELTCGSAFLGGFSKCTDGTWSAVACMPLGILDASIVNAQTGAAVEAATAYVDGFFDPVTGECAASDHCAVSAVNGTVTFDAFPPGPQRVIIVKEGFEQVALPVEIAPGDAQQVQVNMAPAGLLNGNIVLLLDWATGVDLDLVVSIPVGGAGGDQCVFGTGSKNAFPGNLTDVPYAQLEREANGKGAANRLETVRIALNEDKTGPYYDGAYSIVVNSYNASVIDEAAPVVRVVRASESGAAAIELFTLPTDAVEDPTGWHVFDLHGDGTLTAGGTTEAREASADPSDLSECTTSSIEYNNQ